MLGYIKRPHSPTKDDMMQSFALAILIPKVMHELVGVSRANIFILKTDKCQNIYSFMPVVKSGADREEEPHSHSIWNKTSYNTGYSFTGIWQGIR